MPIGRAVFSTCRPISPPGTTASTTHAWGQSASKDKESRSVPGGGAEGLHSMNTLHYLGRRFVSTIPMLVLVGLITFLLIHITPGDPAAVVAGENASAQA